MSIFLQTEVAPEQLAQARAGDEAAQAALFEAFGPAVLGLARRMLGRPEPAEEVLQDTFVEVLTKLDTFRGAAPIGAWIRRIAVNKSLQTLRRRKRSFDARAAFRPLVEPVVNDPGIGLDLAAALDALPALSRAVIWLHDVEGYTHREIGELLGRSASFSKSRLARSHAALREWFEPMPDGEPATPPGLDDGRMPHACQP